MGIINLNSSLRYSHCGRKRKTKAFTVKKKPPVDFKSTPQYKQTIRRQEQQYKSLMEEYMKDGKMPLGNPTPKRESPVYTGTLVKGIATMHKSNAVPVISQKEAEEISKMSS